MSYLKCPNCEFMMAYNKYEQDVTCSLCKTQQKEEVVYCIKCKSKLVIKPKGFFKLRGLVLKSK